MKPENNSGSIPVSVIVPVYNCEKYIRKCIDSILAQTLTNFELILVLDGKVDSCPEICKDYAKCDARIHVFEQENQGVSAARNKGLDNAVGEYILFVDSDDWIEPECLLTLITKARETRYDIVICGFYTEKKASTAASGFFEFDDRTFSKEEAFFLCRNCLLGNQQKQVQVILGNPWAKLYKRSLIEQHHLRFPVGLQYGEDVVFNLTTFWYSKCSVLLPDHLYHYLFRDDSISRVYNPKMREYVERVCKYAWEFRDIINKPEWELVCKDRWVLSLFDVITYQYIPAKCPLNRIEKVKAIRAIVESEDAPYKCAFKTRKSYLAGRTKVFWYLLRLRQYWFIYLYCEWKYGKHAK